MVIISLIGGLIATSPYIIKKNPNAKEILDKIIPIQGWIGLILLVLSIYNLFKGLGNFNLISLGLSTVQFIVGFLLSYGLLSKYILEKSDEAKEKGKELRMKLLQYQVPAGFILVILAIISLMTI